MTADGPRGSPSQRRRGRHRAGVRPSDPRRVGGTRCAGADKLGLPVRLPTSGANALALARGGSKGSRVDMGRLSSMCRL